MRARQSPDPLTTLTPAQRRAYRRAKPPADAPAHIKRVYREAAALRAYWQHGLCH